MCGFPTKEEENVFLRRRILEKRNLPKHKQKRCFESRENKADSLQTVRKPFSSAINLETTQLYGKQTKTFFSCKKLSTTCFSQEKAKMVFSAI